MGHALAAGQPGEGAPRRLVWEQGQQEIEETRGGQEGQQVDSPQLGGTESRARSPRWARIPVLVDEGIWNVGIQAGQKFVGAGHGQMCVHAHGLYRVGPHLSPPSP